jgi:hypothetical protein
MSDTANTEVVATFVPEGTSISNAFWAAQIKTFRTEAAFESWMRKNHAREREVWLRIYNAAACHQHGEVDDAAEDQQATGPIRRTLDGLPSRLTPALADSWMRRARPNWAAPGQQR